MEKHTSTTVCYLKQLKRVQTEGMARFPIFPAVTMKLA
jgi:hypothetical protein